MFRRQLEMAADSEHDNATSGAINNDVPTAHWDDGQTEILASLPSDSTPNPDLVSATVEGLWKSVADKDCVPAATIRLEAEFKKVDCATTSRDSALQVNVADVHLVERSIRSLGVKATERAEYEFLKVLGTGGMGVVYQARQTSVNRTVAVKTLRPADKPDADLDRKFLEEAIVTGDLDHPNIVPIHDLGRTSDGMLFYAMKEVRGTPWNAVIQTKTLDENLHILMRIADAIAFAHSRGVIHRDLKPANVMLGEFGEVLVLDWGLALPMASFASSMSMGGTPRYMAPELVTGPLGSIGPQSDVYLLGALLFEIITGSAPHAGKTSKLTLIAAASNEIVDAPALNGVDPSGELLEIAHRAMRTLPRERFASVIAFQAAIREYQSHSESIALVGRANALFDQAQPDGDYDKFAQALFGFQNALELWGANTAASAGLAAVRTSYAETALAHGDFDLGLSILPDEESQTELRQLLFAGREERDARQARVKRLKRVARSLAVAISGVLLIAVTWISQAERTASRQRDIAQEQERLAKYHFNLARNAVDEMLTEVGQEQLAHVPRMKAVQRRLLSQALEYYKQFLDVDVSNQEVRLETANAYSRVGIISRKLGESNEALEAFQSAVAMYENLLTDSGNVERATEIGFELAKCHNELGELFRQTEPSKAETEYAKSIARFKKLNVVIVDSAATVDSKTNATVTDINAAGADSADADSASADSASANVTDDAVTDAKCRSELARALYNQGLLFWSLNRQEDAAASYDAAIGLLAKLRDESGASPNVLQGLARAYLNRGVLRGGSEQSAAAEADYNSAIQLLTEALELASDRVDLKQELATTYNNLGNLLLKSPDSRDRALEALQAGEESLRQLSSDFPDYVLFQQQWANSLNSLGGVHFRRKEDADAERLWVRSKDVTARLVESHPNVPLHHSFHGRPLTNLGWLKYRQAKYSESQEHMRSARQHHQQAHAGNPENRDFRTFLHNSTLGLAMSSLKLSDHAAVASAADDLHLLSPDDAATSYSAATYLVRCITLVGETSGLKESDKKRLREDYRTRSLRHLERAVQQGIQKVESLDNDAWLPLQDDPEFLRLKELARATLQEQSSQPN